MKAIAIPVLVAGLALASACEPAPSPQSTGGMPSEEPVGQEATIPSLPDPNAPAPVGVELSAAGELAQVDMDLSMVRLNLDDGTSATYQYTETTEITGTSGAQGLAAREGSRALVRYDETTTPPTAVAIEIVEEPGLEPTEPELEP